MKVVVVPSNCFDSSKPQGGRLWSSRHRPLTFSLAPGFLLPTAASSEESEIDNENLEKVKLIMMIAVSLKVAGAGLRGIALSLFLLHPGFSDRCLF